VIREPRVYREQGTVRVTRPDVLRGESIDLTVVADPSSHDAQWRDALTEFGVATVVLKAHERTAIDVDDDLAHRATFTSSGTSVDESDALVLIVTLDREARAEQLQSGAHGEHERAVCDAGAERRRPQQIGPESLGTILSPAEQVDRRVGKFVVDPDTDELRVDAASTGPFDEDHRVTAVPVGPQELGVDERPSTRAGPLAPLLKGGVVGDDVDHVTGDVDVGVVARHDCLDARVVEPGR
jgi:hypothetical protein